MKGLKKDNTGYDLKQIFIGSEGTLGVITSAAIQTVPEPKSTNVACFQLDSFEKVQEVFKAARDSLGEILSAFEFWDGACEGILQAEGKKAIFGDDSSNLKFYVLLETGGSDRIHDEDKLNKFLEKVMSDELVVDGVVAQDQTQQIQFWSRREGIPEACSKLPGLVHKFDLSFPADCYYKLLPLIREIKSVKEKRIGVFGFGHVGDGNIHINLVDYQQKDKYNDNDKFNDHISEISKFIFDWTIENGGSVSAEHGIGQAKRAELVQSKAPVEMEMMRGLKNLFDPNGILNPGKVL